MADDKFDTAERKRREAAVQFARANVELLGFRVSPGEEVHCQRFVNGEIDLAEFVGGQGAAGAAHRNESLVDFGRSLPRDASAGGTMEGAGRPRGSSQPMRKSVRLGLSFPYDWSNPAIGDEVLILNVLKRGIYTDICRVCAHYGLETVEQLRTALPDSIAYSPSLVRMLDNIKKGFARARRAALHDRTR